MHFLLKLVSLILILNLTLVTRSIALSFTSLNPFKSQYRSQLISIDNVSYTSNLNNAKNANINSNLNNYQATVQATVQSTQQQPLQLNVADSSTIKSKWPNMRFMRTFLRSGSNLNTPTNGQSNNNQYVNNKSHPSHFILGFNPPNDNLKQLTKLPPEQVSNDNENIGLIDWNKVFVKLNRATGFKQQVPTSDLNETAIRVRHPEFYSSSSPSNQKKEAEEKESNNNNLLNYFTTFFSSNLNENETMNAEKQLTKTKSTIDSNSQSKIDSSIVDLFYFNENLLAKKQIEVLVCDKTMAIINVRKNRYKTDRIVQNCVLFDLEKRGKEADETVKKLKINKLDIDFFTMMNVINQCKRFSEPANRIDSTVESVVPTKVIKSIPPGNNFKISNITINSNLSIQTDNKSSINLLTGIVSGTLWCGLGDLAKNYTDLGPRKDLDICCRAHDHCPIRLRALKYGYGILNFGISTKSHCQCDKDFFQCLKNVNTKLSNTIGNVYFNVLKLQCIEEGSTCVEFEEKNQKKECIKKKNLMQFKPADAF